MTKEGIKSSETRDNIEVLRVILENEQRRNITYKEAQVIGESLVAFYEVLASN